MSENTGSGTGTVEPASEPWTVTFEKVTAVRGLLALHLVAMVAAFLPPSVPGVVTAPPVVFGLTFVPGGLAVLLLYEDLRVSARTVLYAMGLSLISLLGMGLVINLFLPRVGIKQPLATLPLAVSVTLIVTGLAVAVLRRKSSGTVTASLPLPLSPVPVLLTLLPLLSILTVTYLNVTQNNGPVLALLVVLGVLPLVAILRFDVRWHAYAVWFLALAILYHKSFWKNFGFSGSPGVIRAWQAKQWTPGVTEVHPYSTELLQNGVLFPTYARLSGITIITELEVVNPFLVAFIPLGVFVAARQYFGSRHGLLAAGLFSFAHPFYMQYPTAGRAATPVLFLSLFAVVLTDDDTSTLRTSLFGIVFASGIVVTHYGTSYFVMFAILGALGFLLAIRYLDTLLDERLPEAAPDGGLAVSPRPDTSTAPARSVLRWTLALYYTVGAIGWYMYATQGQKFKTLPYHVISSIRTMTDDQVVSGRTGARIQRDYGSQSIRLSKIMYAGFGMLMGFGILYAFYRRFFKRDRSLVDDQYVVLASVMLAIFGSTFIARNWGGGRPMMITLAFTTPFSVLGALAIGHASAAIEDSKLGRTTFSRWMDRGTSPPVVVFAVLLLVLFSLNTGLASAVVIDGRSPSNVPWSEAQDSHRSIDIAGHVWLNDHGTGSVYGDPVTHGQTDWLLPEIELQSGADRSYGAGLNKPRGDLLTLRDDPAVEPGYLLMLSHNMEDREISQRFAGENVPFSEFERELDRRSVIYSTEVSAVYYAPDDPESTEE